jgi:enoyl-CoA hydratase
MKTLKIMPWETIFVEQRDAVTLITLDRPQALNAINTQVLDELAEAFAPYDADRSQRCAVLTGSGKAFPAGADIKQMSDKPAAETAAFLLRAH